MNVYRHIAQIGDVHDRVHVVGRVGREDDCAVVAAPLKGIDNGGRIVGGVGGAGGNDAGQRSGGGMLQQRRKSKHGETAQQSRGHFHKRASKQCEGQGPARHQQH